MTGIVSYGAYIPRYRMPREVIARAWGEVSPAGERAVANYDEDSVTMAVESVLNCLEGFDPKAVGGLFFASTTSPYREKLGSTLIATVADLGGEILTADHASSLRCGTAALKAALDSVNSGSADNVLVAVADCRQGEPGSNLEHSFGDSAAALLIGKSKAICSVEGVYSLSKEFIDYWRKADDTFVRAGDTRFIRAYGYEATMAESITGVLNKYQLQPRDFTKVIFPAPDLRSHSQMASRLGFGKSQVQDTLYASVGDTGAAQPFVMLVAALEEARPGDRFLLVSYGDGSDAFVLRVTDEIRNLGARRGVKAFLNSKRVLSNYTKFLNIRRLIKKEV